MPRVRIQLETPVPRTFRVDQVAGLFDVPVAAKSRLELSVHLPALAGPEATWHIGAIVGPSGAGKSAVARAHFGKHFIERIDWPGDRAIVDAFPEDRSMRQITEALNAVGFSSPPAWVLPYGALSTGQRMRCDLARALLMEAEAVAFDEFTSVVDRQVGRVASAAVAKAVRRGRVPLQRFVVVTCHYDVLDWLEPDWVLDMADRRLVLSPDSPLRGSELAKLPRGCLRWRPTPWRRPRVTLRVRRCRGGAYWPLFGRHHYLSATLHRASRGYLAELAGEPVAFLATLPNAGHRGRRIVHRLVVLPDYQGLGVGLRLLDVVAELEDRQLRRKVPDLPADRPRISIRTSHPALIGALRRGGRSGRWRILSVNRLGTHHHGFSRSERRRIGSAGRTVVSFGYGGD